MAQLRIEGEELVLDVEGIAARLMALCSRIRIPLGAVTAARQGAPELFEGGLWLRAFGASFVERHVGYYWHKGDGLSFVDVRHLTNRDAIVAIDLDAPRLRHLYIEPSDDSAARVVERINRPARR